MFKKTLLTTLAVSLALPLNSMAYYTVIKNATTQEIRDAIVQMAAQSGQPFTIDTSNDYGITIITNGTIAGGLFGETPIAVEDKHAFTFTDAPNGVGVNCSIIETRSAATGANFTQPLPPIVEIHDLAPIKAKFDGAYSFGFDLSTQKEKGGYEFTDVTPGMPMANAGIEVGDILLKVNGKKVPKNKATGQIDDLALGQNRLAQQVWNFEVLKKNGQKQTYTISSQFFTPEEMKKLFDAKYQ